MSTIQQGVTDTVNNFLTANLPPELASAPNLTEEIGVLKAKLAKEKKELEISWNDAQKVKGVYQYLSTDAKSLNNGQPSFRSLLAEKNSYYLAQLAKLDEEGVAALEQALIDCTRDASTLAGNFKGIFKLLTSLEGDLKKGAEADYSYNEMQKHLANMDEAKKSADKEAIKPEDSLVDRFENFKAKNTKTELETIKTKVEAYYQSMIVVSLDYQKVLPLFDQLKSLQVSLATAITNLETDLTTKTDVAIKAATDELTLLYAKKEALFQLNLVDPNLFPDPDPTTESSETKEKAPETAKKAVAGKAKAPEKEKSTPAIPKNDPLKDVILEIKAAEAALTENQDNKKSYKLIIERLKAVLGYKKEFNAKLDVHVKALRGTKAVGLDIVEQVEELKKLIGIQETLLNDLYQKNILLKGNKNMDTITTAFIKDIKGLETEHAGLETEHVGLETIQERIVALNEGISKAEFNSDIKEYFGKIVGKMETFPESVAKVVNNALTIEQTLKNLNLWTKELKGNLGDELATSLAASGLAFEMIPEKELASAAKNETVEEPVTASSKQRIDNLILELIGKKRQDDELSFPDGPIPIEIWKKGKYKETFSGDSKVLADWLSFFEDELKAVEIDDAAQKKKKEFLTKLHPEKALAEK